MDDITRQLRESCFCEGRHLCWRPCELCRAADEIERLRAELAECKRDAERYRWLRSDDCPFSCYEQEGPDNWGWCPTSSRDLDEAIDAAMAGGEHG